MKGKLRAERKDNCSTVLSLFWVGEKMISFEQTKNNLVLTWTKQTEFITEYFDSKLTAEHITLSCDLMLYL